MKVITEEVCGLVPNPNLSTLYFNDEEKFMGFIKRLYKRMGVEDEEALIFNLPEQKMFIAEDLVCVLTTEL